MLISSVQHAGAGADPLPLEQVTLDFRSLEMEVVKENPDGSPGGSTKTTCSSRPLRE